MDRSSRQVANRYLSFMLPAEVSLHQARCTRGDYEREPMLYFPTAGAPRATQCVACLPPGSPSPILSYAYRYYC